MLTNKQCIEIAEKVWRWAITELEPPNFPEKWWRDVEGNKKFPVYETATTIYSQALKNEILSWQGFGRTVEILKEKDMPHTLAVILFDVSKASTDSQDFIRRFQLLALSSLEALKDG